MCRQGGYGRTSIHNAISAGHADAHVNENILYIKILKYFEFIVEI